MDMDTLAREVQALMHRQYGGQAEHIWVGLMTTSTGWHLELPRGYQCPLPAGTTPLPYDTTRYRMAYDAFDDALHTVWHQFTMEQDNRLPDDDEDDDEPDP